MPTEAQQFSIRLLNQLKANGNPTSATYLARQFSVTPHATRQWLNGIFIPKEQNMQFLAQWLKVDTSWLRYGGVLEDSFVADYMSRCEADRATIRAVVGAVWAIKSVMEE
jgi:transcriptional regulator with XRE-family HTH domain